MERKPLSAHFNWKDALYLPQWKVQHLPTAGEIVNIKRMADVMEKIRTLCGDRPISIHCWSRPVLMAPGHPKHGQDYNALVKGAPSSMHKKGLAVDFSVVGMSCDDVRVLLSMKLKELGIRMERNPGSNWVHVDLRPVVNDADRYFHP